MIRGTEAEYQSDAGSTKDTPYLTLTGNLWGVFVNICEKIDHFIAAPHCSQWEYKDWNWIAMEIISTLLAIGDVDPKWKLMNNPQILEFRWCVSAAVTSINGKIHREIS